MTQAKPTPSIPLSAPADYEQDWMSGLCQQLTVATQKPSRSGDQQQPWNVTSVVPSFSFDAASATPQDTANFAAWLFTQLYSRGLLS